MQSSDRIVIVPSEELVEMGLMDLAFRNAHITEICRNSNSVYGVWAVLVGEPYLGESEWFIPTSSIYR